MFDQPMVPAEFGYSTRGALAAMSVALGMAAVLYAFMSWPLETIGWLAIAGVLRYVGRHPITEVFR